MELRDLIKGCEHTLSEDITPIEIEGICHDSRKCSKNYLFVAIQGLKNDGHDFIDAAIENGAIAVVHQFPFKSKNDDIAFIQVKDSRRALSKVSSAFYENPSSKLKVIGVTGTNGKTSTTYFLKEILEHAGRKTGVVGTLGAKYGDVNIDLHNTTPESLELQFLLSKMADMGAEYVVMEVSSHGIAMGRVDDIRFQGGIFTNLTQDHLDYHNTMEEYYNAKKNFLDMPMEYKIINLDGGYGQKMYSEIVKNDSRVIGFGMSRGEAVLRDINHNNDLIEFKMSINKYEFSYQTGLIGNFNIYNLTGAILAGIEEGVEASEIEECVKALQGVPGRMDQIPIDSNYRIVIDYAHTPDGLENVLTALREGCKGRLITLFGCGGDRDRGKRPLMGKIAGQLSDYCIVTSDNPRWEDPDSIIDDIIPGIDSTNVDYIRITNRKDAIQKVSLCLRATTSF